MQHFFLSIIYQFFTFFFHFENLDPFFVFSKPFFLPIFYNFYLTIDLQKLAVFQHHKCGGGLKYGKDCCERQKSTSFGEELFIRIMFYYLPSQELFLTHVTAPHNRTESVICLHLLYICPITCICFQHMPYISSIHY